MAILPVLAVTATVYYLAKSGKGLQQLEIRELSKLRVSMQGLTGIVLRFDIKVYNPNSYDIPFTSFTGQLLYKNQKVCNINTTASTPVKLVNRSVTAIPVKIDESILVLAPQMYDVLQKVISRQTASETVTITGTLKADVFTAPVNQQIPLSI